jgi:hypothetical protein
VINKAFAPQDLNGFITLKKLYFPFNSKRSFSMIIDKKVDYKNSLGRNMSTILNF